METITGRLTASATVKTINGDRQVVNFTIAVNDRYKTKAGERKEITRYVQCAYWSAVGIAPFLTKGLLVELHGRMDISVWNNQEGKAKGTLTMQVVNVKLHGKSTGNRQEPVNETVAAVTTTATEDLPF